VVFARSMAFRVFEFEAFAFGQPDSSSIAEFSYLWSLSSFWAQSQLNPLIFGATVCYSQSAYRTKQTPQLSCQGTAVGALIRSAAVSEAVAPKVLRAPLSPWTRLHFFLFEQLWWAQALAEFKMFLGLREFRIWRDCPPSKSGSWPSHIWGWRELLILRYHRPLHRSRGLFPSWTVEVPQSFG